MNYEELRRLAEGATPEWNFQVWRNDSIRKTDDDYIAAASPDVILALLDERERLRDLLRRETGLAHAYLRADEHGSLHTAPTSIACDGPSCRAVRAILKDERQPIGVFADIIDEPLP